MKNIYIYIIRQIGKIIPVQNTIIFESAPSMTDSARVLFDGMIAKTINERYKLIWYVDLPLPQKYSKYLTLKNVIFRENTSVNLLSKIILHLKRDIAMASCKYYIFSNINYSKVPPKSNQMFYYTTHGIGLKQVKDRLYPSKLFSRVAVMSDLSKDWLSAVYDETDIKAVNNGHPRLDLLKRVDKKTDEKYRRDFKISKDFKLIIWVPTYRTHQSGTANDLNNDVNDSDIPILKKQSDWNRINKALIDSRIILILKPHPAQNLEKVKIENYSNIRMLSNKYLHDNDIHLYSFLNIVDGMITDYSSIGYDFLLADKPLAFSVDDIDVWSKNVGFIDGNIYEYMPGHILSSVEDFEKYIYELSKDTFATERRQLERQYHNFNDQSSTYRTIEFLKL